MKKDYLKPESNVVVFSIDNVILSTSNIENDNESSMPGLGGGIGEKDQAAGRNRGEWGNVWGK